MRARRATIPPRPLNAPKWACFGHFARVAYIGATKSLTMADNQTKIKGCPLYRATLQDDSQGMTKISLVESPAVISNFVAFAGVELPEQVPAPQRFAVQDEAEHRVLGVVMRANCPIIRYDKRIGYYFIYYDADTIREMAERYLVEGRQNAVNLQHEDGTDTDAVHLVQWFIKDKGLAPEGFEDIEDGSLFAEFHVTDDTIWEGVKDGSFKGFSLEGFFGMEAATEEVSTEKIALSQKQDNMSTMQRLKAAILAAFEAEENAPATEQEQEQKFGSVSTDQGVLRWEGDEALKEGDAVKLVDEEGNESDAPDGTYETETHTITVADGKVSAIADKAAEEAEPEGEQEAAAVEAPADAFASIAAKLSASFDDKYRAIYGALFAIGIDAYIIAAGDDFAIVQVWNEGADKYFRYELSFSEDGYECTLGDSVEVFPAWATAEQRDEIERQNAARDEELAAVKAELAALKDAPASEPAHEQFKAAEKVAETSIGRIYSLLK